MWRIADYGENINSPVPTKNSECFEKSGYLFRSTELCNELRLGGVAAQYTALAQKAAEKHTSFTDFSSRNC